MTEMTCVRCQRRGRCLCDYIANKPPGFLQFYQENLGGGSYAWWEEWVLHDKHGPYVLRLPATRIV